MDIQYAVSKCNCNVGIKVENSELLRHLPETHGAQINNPVLLNHLPLGLPIVSKLCTNFPLYFIVSFLSQSNQKALGHSGKREPTTFIF